MPPEKSEAASAVLALPEILALLKQVDGRLGDIEADVSRLSKLADQAEKFLHNPIGAYKAARGKLIPRGPSA